MTNHEADFAARVARPISALALLVGTKAIRTTEGRVYDVVQRQPKGYLRARWFLTGNYTTC